MGQKVVMGMGQILESQRAPIWPTKNPQSIAPTNPPINNSSTNDFLRLH